MDRDAPDTLPLNRFLQAQRVEQTRLCRIGNLRLPSGRPLSAEPNDRKGRAPRENSIEGLVESKLALSKTLQALRAAQHLSQVDVARRLQSSQSRVAKMEASDPSVPVDLLVESLIELGAQSGDIAKARRPRRKVPAV